MEELKEKRYLAALSDVLADGYPNYHFCLSGYAEEAVCMEKKDSMWEIYVGERGKHRESNYCNSISEACIEFIKLVCGSKEAPFILDKFFDRLIEVSAA